MYGSKYQMWRIPRYAGLKSNNLKKLNDHSFFGNPFYHWLSGHHKQFLVLFAQDFVNCLMRSAAYPNGRRCRNSSLSIFQHRYIILLIISSRLRWRLVSRDHRLRLRWLSRIFHYLIIKHRMRQWTLTKGGATPITLTSTTMHRKGGLLLGLSAGRRFCEAHNPIYSELWAVCDPCEGFYRPDPIADPFERRKDTD